MVPRTLQAVAILALLAVFFAASPAKAARLDVQGGPMRQLRFTCEDVKALQGNCGTLCDCVRKQNPSGASGCESLCEGCVSAASNCVNTPGAALPKACSDYQSQAAACTGRRRAAF